MRPPLHELIDLGGRTAVVTGGAKGIGLAIVRRLHEAGANVVIADLDVSSAQSDAHELESARAGSALAIDVDVSDPGSVDALVAGARERFGAIDVLVNNAGIFPAAPLADLDLDQFRRVVDVNLTGLYLCTRKVAAAMIERGEGGRIVNITSIDALHPSMVGLAAYDASKHGAWGFTKNVALELAQHRIWVNAIAPGGVLTPGVGEIATGTLDAFEQLIPMRRMADPDDIARMALVLCTDLASYVTGSQVVVDGGRLLG